MARANRFTPEEDARIIAMRMQGLTWNVIAGALGRSHARVHERGVRVIGLARGHVQPEEARLSERDLAGCEPLPPFHPIAASVLGFTSGWLRLDGLDQAPLR